MQFGICPSGQKLPLVHIAAPLELDEDEDEDEELEDEEEDDEVVLHIGSPGGLQTDIASTQQGVLSAKQTGISPGIQFGT